jgi:3-oxoacid CoA-transferase A subunit
VLYKEGKIELEVLPQGTFVESIRAAGAGIPAYFTPTAFGTDLAAGKEVRNFDGRDYVLEKSIPGDAALIRADLADRWGNLTFRHAQMNFGPAMATASKLVVAEVRAFSDTPIPPEQVMLSGVFVDRIFVAGA